MSQIVDDFSRALALEIAADETDDARDHDELHAAADVVRAGIHSRYIDRWIDELEKRWLSNETGLPKVRRSWA